MTDTVRLMRRFSACCVTVLALAGCSGGASDSPEGRADRPPDAVPEGGPASADEEANDDQGTSESAVSVPVDGDAPLYEVTFDVSVERLDLTERLEVAIDPAELDDVDPFTHFSSCSGLRASISTFTVTAVDETGGVRSVSAVTAEHVLGPGIYDVDVRVEPVGADPVSAVGTLTVDQSLRSGSFRAFEATGEAVSGAFECDGPGDTAVPIVDDGTADGVLRSVEVVALLRRGTEERIVGLTLDPAEVVAVEAECSGVSGGDLLVHVDGGQAVGAITAFDLGAEPEPSLRMQVGGASYDVADVALALDETGAAGSFSGVTDDGVAVDGAFRCG